MELETLPRDVESNNNESTASPPASTEKYFFAHVRQDVELLVDGGNMDCIAMPLVQSAVVMVV
jgi:hypothetical protein